MHWIRISLFEEVATKIRRNRDWNFAPNAFKNQCQSKFKKYIVETKFVNAFYQLKYYFGIKHIFGLKSKQSWLMYLRIMVSFMIIAMSLLWKWLKSLKNNSVQFIASLKFANFKHIEMVEFMEQNSELISVHWTLYTQRDKTATKKKQKTTKYIHRHSIVTRKHSFQYKVWEKSASRKWYCRAIHVGIINKWIPQIELSGSSRVNKVFDVFVSIICCAMHIVHLFENLMWLCSCAYSSQCHHHYDHCRRFHQRMRFYFVFKWALIWSSPSLHSLTHTLLFHKNVLWPFSYCSSSKCKWYILHLTECMHKK